MNPFNGRRVVRSEDGKVIFIPLPRAQWSNDLPPNAAGNACSCAHCLATREAAHGYFDTIAIAAKTDRTRSYAADTTWTVHAPHLRIGPDYCACAGCMATRRAESERRLRAAK